MVATYHCGLLIKGYHHGVVAVISFILISGYVMTLLIEKYYVNKFGLFYLDRLARLTPQFLFYSVIALFAMMYTHLGEVRLSWMNFSTCENTTLALNFLIFTNNFYTFFGNCMLLPQSWSLGLEAFFYLTIPAILVQSLNRIRLIIALSFIVFLAGYLGYINFDLWAYRYLPGTLYIFLVGSAIANPKKYPNHFTFIIFVICIILFIYINVNKSIYNLTEVKEVVLGIILGIPVLMWVRRIKPKKLDNFFGNCSYGLFLNHVLFIWIMEINNIRANPYSILLMLIGATLLAYISFTFIEKPMLAIRRSWRTPTISPRGLTDC